MAGVALDRHSTLALLRTRLRAVAPPLAHDEDDDWTRKVAHLRALVRQRERSSPRDSWLPGTEVAPGLRVIDHMLDTPLLPRRAGAVTPPLLSADLATDAHWEIDNGKTTQRVATDSIVAFDIETTGLSLGVGTRSFLVGTLTRRAGHWRIRQWLLTDPEGESRLIAAFLADLPADPVLVSYNGKTFDAPMLAGSARLAGLDWPDFAHLDLLPVVRRRFGKNLSNCKLPTVETELLGRPRGPDMPSSEVPAAWRQYLRCADAVPLRAAIKHHHSDLLSLLHLLMFCRAQVDVSEPLLSTQT